VKFENMDVKASGKVVSDRFDTKTHRKRSKRSESEGVKEQGKFVVSTALQGAMGGSNSFVFSGPTPGNEVATIPVVENAISIIQQARLVENELKAEADLVKRGADTISASFKRLNSDILTSIAEENNVNASALKEVIDDNAHNLTSQSIDSKVVQNMMNLRTELRLIDYLLTYLRTSENITAIVQSLDFQKPWENIQRELTELKTQGKEAKEVLADIVKSLSKVNKQMTSYWGTVLVFNHHDQTSDESEESMMELLFGIRSNLSNYDEFLADDNESLACIKKKIGRMRNGRMLSWSVMGVAISFGYLYMVYYLHSRRGVDYSHPLTAVMGLGMLCSVPHKAYSIYYENGEMDDCWTKNYERFKRQQIDMHNLKALEQRFEQAYVNQVQNSRQNVGNLTITTTQGIVQGVVPTMIVPVAQQGTQPQYLMR